MSRYLFVMMEGGGTVPPELAIAQRLVGRGHNVRVIGDPTIGPSARAAGCGFKAWEKAPHVISVQPEHVLIRDWEMRSPLQTFAALRDKLMCGPALQFAQEVLAELAAHPADAVASDMMILGGLIAAEKAQLPSALLIPNVYPFPAPGRPIMGPGMLPAKNLLERLRDVVLRRAVEYSFDSGVKAVNDARRALALPKLRGVLEQHARANVQLVLSEEAFDYPEPVFPANVRFVGAQLDDPDWAQTWQSPWPAGDPRPLVLVALSSTYQAQANTLRRIIEALTPLPVRALLTKGPALAAHSFDAPSHVHVVESAPHTIVLREAALTISHCGHGTTLKALAAGVPLLCLPMGRDQADNAARVVYHEAGVRLRPSAPPEAMRSAIQQLRGDPRYRAGAARLAKAIHEQAHDDRAVRELERLTASSAAPSRDREQLRPHEAN